MEFFPYIFLTNLQIQCLNPLLFLIFIFNNIKITFQSFWFLKMSWKKVIFSALYFWTQTMSWKRTKIKITDVIIHLYSNPSYSLTHTFQFPFRSAVNATPSAKTAPPTAYTTQSANACTTCQASSVKTSALETSFLMKKTRSASNALMNAGVAGDPRPWTATLAGTSECMIRITRLWYVYDVVVF